MNACTFCYVTILLKTINKNENVMAICKIRLPWIVKKLKKSICNLGFSANMHNIFRHCKDWCDIPCKTNVIWHVISITFICLQLFFYLIRRLYSYLYSMINNYKKRRFKMKFKFKEPMFTNQKPSFSYIINTCLSIVSYRGVNLYFS